MRLAIQLVGLSLWTAGFLAIQVMPVVADEQAARVEARGPSAVNQLARADEPNASTVKLSLQPDKPESTGTVRLFLDKWGDGADARLEQPFGIDFDSAGNAYIVEITGSRVLMVDRAGQVSTIAGAYKVIGDAGDGGPAIHGRFNSPHNLTVTPDGDVLIADTRNGKIRKIDGDNRSIDTIVGTGKSADVRDGGPATQANLGHIYCATLDTKRERLYLVDLDNRRVYFVDLETGQIHHVAGSGMRGIPADGSDAKTSPLVDPRAVAADSRGNIYIVERSGNALRVVDPSGKIRTVVGASGQTGNTGDGGDARTARLNGPKHLCIDSHDDVLIADTENHTIRKYIPSTGRIERVAGTGRAGIAGVGGPPRDAELARPHGVIQHADGNIYIADSDNGRVLKIEL